MAELLDQIDPDLRRMAGKFCNGRPIDDALQDARIGAWRAVSRWDPSRGDLMPYVIQRARGQMLDGLRSRTQLRRKRNAGYVNEHGEPLFDVSLDKAIDFADEGDDLSLGAAVLVDGIDPGRVAAGRDELDRVYRWAATLPDREREVFESMLSGDPMGPIAERHGVTESRLSQIRQELERRARAEANGTHTDSHPRPTPSPRRERPPMTQPTDPIDRGSFRFAANIPIGETGSVAVAIDAPFGKLDDEAAAFVRTLLEQSMERLATGTPNGRPALPSGGGNQPKQGRSVEKIPCPQGCGGMFSKGAGMAKHLAGGKCTGAAPGPEPPAEPTDPEETPERLEDRWAS